MDDALTELIAWFRLQLDVDEAEADAILSPPPGYYDKGWQAEKLREFAMRQLDEIEAKRRILNEFSWEAGETRAIMYLAESHAGRAGWRKEWRVQ